VFPDISFPADFHGLNRCACRQEGKAGRGLDEDEARSIMRMLLDGIKYLHAQHIVHRDLKLSNLLLTSDMQVRKVLVRSKLAIKLPRKKNHKSCFAMILTRSVQNRQPRDHSICLCLYMYVCILYRICKSMSEFLVQSSSYLFPCALQYIVMECRQGNKILQAIVCVRVRVRACVYIHTYAHTYMHTRTHNLQVGAFLKIRHAHMRQCIYA
jgi:hypothetical protein